MGPLTAAGLRPDLPTAWLAEGLLLYLHPHEADSLLTSVTALSAPGSVLAGEYFNRRVRWEDVPDMLSEEEPIARVFLAADRGGPLVEPVPWAAGNGWSATQRDFVDVVAELGRPVPALMAGTGPDALVLWLFHATFGRPRTAG
ncbi:hypothetical protein BJF78_14585 [Pseudonocardia sp. CNS-139]|nr:hypothetical protein BJF78_14585 [Pseudonocardia sp. CNS-139]